MNHRIFDDEQIKRMNEQLLPVANEINSKVWKNQNCLGSKRLSPHRPNLDWEEMQMIKKFYQECPKGYEVDHIIPLNKGGKHCLANMQWLTKKENTKKRCKIVFGVDEYPKCFLIKKD